MRDRASCLATSTPNSRELSRPAEARAALAVNQELVMLYWGIGTEITRRQKAEGWGTRVIDNLGRDLKIGFPEMQGLSARNLKYMKAFADAWSEESIVQQPVAQLPWGRNVRLRDKVKAPERLWYIQAAVEIGCGRKMLALHIESRLVPRWR